MAGERASGELLYEVAGPVATITLNRPAALNALTVELKVALRAAIHEAGRDRSVRAIVLTGAGRAFCAGQDLRERLEPDAARLEVELRERYNPLVLEIRRLAKPIVAALNGVAAGAGASLALACDLRVAASDATLVLAFGRLGLVPDTGMSWLLPRLVGPAKALELALLGEPLAADEAARLGLISRVVERERLPAEVAAIASQLAALAPRAVAETKRAFDRAIAADFESTLEDEAYRQGVLGRSADHAEGLAAFLQKRPPRFSGE